MPTEASDIDSYDPDHAPDEQNSGFTNLLTLIQSVKINNAGEAAASGGEIARAYDFFTSGEYARPDGTPCWILVYNSVDAVRPDGSPLVYTERLPLLDKNGKVLSKVMAPSKLAGQFLSLGVSASWYRTGESDSAVGRVFRAATKHEVELAPARKGKDAFTRTFQVWPTELMPADFVFDGEVRTVAAKDATTTPEMPGIAATTMSLVEVAALVEGTAADKLIDTLVEGHVPGIVEGVAILDAAFDSTDAFIAALAGRVEVKLLGNEARFFANIPVPA